MSGVTYWSDFYLMVSVKKNKLSPLDDMTYWSWLFWYENLSRRKKENGHEIYKQKRLNGFKEKILKYFQAWGF